MAYPRRFHPWFLVIFLLCQLLHFPAIEANNDGFSVKLIRRNSLRAPSRLMGLANNPNTPHATIYPYLGQHLMELSIGTPPIRIFGIADTGSDLIWTQCVPCSNCYNQINPLFDPTKSSTYTNVPCESELCHKLDTGVCSPQKSCNYTYAYGDSSITHGALAQETVTITSTTGAPLSLKEILFGCGHNDSGTFNDHEMGIIGLGGGPLSLISQISPLFGGKKFSQCLVPFHTDTRISSRMSFGRGSEVSGDGVVSTPLVASQDQTPYLVTLLGISVGGIYLPFNSSQGNVAKGNMLIDSGTPPIYLPRQFYDRIVTQVRNEVAMEPIKDDPELGSQLCYRTTNNLNGPLLTAHFEGADVVLSPTQIFIPPKDGVFCLAIGEMDGEGGIYGNFAQSNYLIGFDLERQVVSFKPTDCTKQ
ncbi:Xylanase inhibitor, C-terminal [Sesbania bispinosa]|nr:Xylanase inhibitor, C-terminal [Sesbania bispinosa]